MTEISSQYSLREDYEELDLDSFFLFLGDSTDFMGGLFIIFFINSFIGQLFFLPKKWIFCKKPVDF